VAVVLSPLVQRRSPNQSTRHATPITHLIWHATAGHYAPSVEWLCNPASDASAHVVLREDGSEATQLVHLDVKAWHAYPYWNLRSVGVEHASLFRGFATHEQLERSARLFGWLCKHLGIPPVHGVDRPAGIVRHRDLGVAGGNHSDGPDDATWFGVFVPLVRENVALGGYRKTYLL
jgi:N-acetyl-anhydromuramyl-L-alanine amidase AmpD